MTEKAIKIPGPDHPITIEANPARVVVSLAGRIVAETREALTLREAKYPPVQYIPRKDVNMSLLERTNHNTYCPYKGDCSYYSTPLAGNARPTPCGHTRDPSPRFQRSRATSPSIPIASTR
jgi:uncharacterized protein (DUF427 family)